MKYRFWIYAVALILFVGISLVRGCSAPDGDPYKRDVGLSGIETSFSLKGPRGQVFQLEEHRDKAVLLFFGFLSCPDVCPMMMTKLSGVYSLLGDDRDEVLTVFVSIDPDRDTPEAIKEYLDYFKIPSIGLTGSKKEIDEVVARYKTYYERVSIDSAVGYVFNHTDHLYFIDRKGKVRSIFHAEDKNEKVAKKIKKILDEDALESGSALVTGKLVYVTKCMICHGATGAGDGPTAAKVSPRPRNFLTDDFKFVSGPQGSLPTDQDLFKIVTEGSYGTAMPSWKDLSEKERWAVIEYIKSLAPERWKKEDVHHESSK